MDKNITVVINTFNEEKNIARVLESVKWADEILICDMYSEDKTVEIAKKMGAKIVFHKREGFVEPARNFAISEASNEWVLVLDADEVIPASLSKKLKEIVKKSIVSDFVEIPTKNIIFGKWIKASMWWPDYHVRFFKKGAVVWTEKIHSKPKTKGMGLTLPVEEKWAKVHYNYQSISQFIERMNRYTTIEASQLNKSGYKFNWSDLIQKPLGEFLSRFFANRGYEDGLHGLALSVLQALSFLIVYLKLWEMEGFTQKLIDLSEINQESRKGAKAFDYWLKQSRLSKNPFKRFLQKAQAKF